MFAVEFLAYILIFITCIAYVIAIYRFCVMEDETAKIAMFVAIICGTCSFGILLGVDATKSNETVQSNEVIQEEVQSEPEDTYEPLSGCTTHVAAEIYDQYQNEDGTYSNVFGVDYSEVQAFIWISEKPLPDDTPYLLTMDNKGTLNNPLDDEILVVWKDMN